MILKEIQPSDTVVLLDEHGADFRSVEYANWLKQKQNTARRLIFIIGGPYGFSPDVYARANEKISLSRMTFHIRWSDSSLQNNFIVLVQL